MFKDHDDQEVLSYLNDKIDKTKGILAEAFPEVTEFLDKYTSDDEIAITKSEEYLDNFFSIDKLRNTNWKLVVYFGDKRLQDILMILDTTPEDRLRAMQDIRNNAPGCLTDNLDSILQMLQQKRESEAKEAIHQFLLSTAPRDRDKAIELIEDIDTESLLNNKALRNVYELCCLDNAKKERTQKYIEALYFLGLAHLHRFEEKGYLFCRLYISRMVRAMKFSGIEVDRANDLKRLHEVMVFVADVFESLDPLLEKIRKGAGSVKIQEIMVHQKNETDFKKLIRDGSPAVTAAAHWAQGLFERYTRLENARSDYSEERESVQREIAHYRAALEVAPSATICALEGRCLWDLLEKDKAKEALSRALELSPKHRLANLLLSEWQRRESLLDVRQWN